MNFIFAIILFFLSIDSIYAQPNRCCLDLVDCLNECDNQYGELCELWGDYSWSCMVLHWCYDDCSDQHHYCCVDS